MGIIRLSRVAYSPEEEYAALALPFPRRIDDGSVWVRARVAAPARPYDTIQQICCAIPSLPVLPPFSDSGLWARNEGAVSGTPQRASHPSTSPSSLTMTAARMPQCDLLYKNLDHRLWSATASHPSPILSFNPFRVNGDRNLRRTGGVFNRRSSQPARACRLLIENRR